jgi:hypothetical protein
MTHACPSWEYPADAHLLKLQRLQNRVLRAMGSFHRGTQVREMPHGSQNSLRVRLRNKYTKQSEVIQNHLNRYVRVTGQGEAIRMISKHKRLKLGGGQAYDRSRDQLPLRSGKVS